MVEAHGSCAAGSPLTEVFGMRIGIDLGGTKTEAVLLAADGCEVKRVRRPSRHSYEGTLTLIVELVEELERRADEHCSVGLGIPGTLLPVSGLVKNANSTWLNGHALDHDLGDRLGRPVRVMNDANCFALSEATDGAGAGANSVFGVIVGTGVGGGLVLGGRVVTGASAIAGEWGHLPLPGPRTEEQPGPRCWCGRSGCVETWLSGPGLAADYQRHTGLGADAAAIAESAGRGDERCAAALTRWFDRFGRALAMVVNIVDPEVVVLGGGLSKIPGVAERVCKSLEPHVFSDVGATRVVVNEHGDSSGVRGAAWLWDADVASSRS